MHASKKHELYSPSPPPPHLPNTVPPGREPQYIEAPRFTNRDTFALDPDSRHVVMMHDEFDMPLPAVAATMNRTVDETASLLEQARTTLREKVETPPPGDAPS